jgi:hypothetical protein
VTARILSPRHGHRRSFRPRARNGRQFASCSTFDWPRIFDDLANGWGQLFPAETAAALKCRIELMSATGDALEALFAALEAKAAEPGAAIPPPLQNESLPARLMQAPDGLQKYLNVWDSEEDAPDEFLGADVVADGYDLTWSVPVELVVAGGERAARRLAFEAGLDAIWDAITVDRTLGGTVSHAEMLTPRRTGAGFVTDGMPNVLAADITVRLSFVSSKSF